MPPVRRRPPGRVTWPKRRRELEEARPPRKRGNERPPRERVRPDDGYLRYEPDLVAPPPEFRTEGPSWLEIEVGRLLPRPARKHKRKHPHRGRHGHPHRKGGASARRDGSPRGGRPERRENPWPSRVALGDVGQVGVRAGYSAAVQELQPGQWLVGIVPDAAITEGYVEVGLLPSAMVLGGLRGVLPQLADARRGAASKGIAPSVAGYGDDRHTWLEVGARKRLPRPRPRRSPDGAWASRVRLGDYAVIGVRGGYSAAVQEVQPDLWLVGIVPDAAVTEGHVEIGIVPIIMALSAAGKLLPMAYKAIDGAIKKRGKSGHDPKLREDIDDAARDAASDAADEVETAGYAGSWGRR